MPAATGARPSGRSALVARVDEAALDAHCRERLAKYKTPKAFRLVPELPQDPSGKVLKRELRARESADDA